MNRGIVLFACAWVLWSYGVGEKTFVWIPTDSFEKLADCKRRAEARQKHADAGSRSSTKFEYLCLPDTLNPVTENPKFP